jgi:hypothetical protein
MSTISSVSALPGPSAPAANFIVAPHKTETLQPTVSSAATAAVPSSQQTIALLEQQMMLYPQFAEGSGSGAAAYKALLYAIQTNNVSDAQSALAKLQRENVPASSASPGPTVNLSSAGTGGDHDGGSGQTQVLSKNSLNVTA